MAELSALDRWQQQIDRYRDWQYRVGTPAWEREQGWYDRWVKANDYHHKTLPYLLEGITTGDRVLEIGPGTGAFTFPLAEVGAEIIGLEPSENMRRSLQEKTKGNGLTNVELLPVQVEESLEIIQQRGSFRLTFASFLLYNVREIDRVLKTLLNRSQQIWILLGTVFSSPCCRLLYQQFTAEKPPAPLSLIIFIRCCWKWASWGMCASFGAVTIYSTTIMKVCWIGGRPG